MDKNYDLKELAEKGKILGQQRQELEKRGTALETVDKEKYRKVESDYQQSKQIYKQAKKIILQKEKELDKDWKKYEQEFKKYQSTIAEALQERPDLLSQLSGLEEKLEAEKAETKATEEAASPAELSHNTMILNYIGEHSEASAQELRKASELERLTPRQRKYTVASLRKAGLITRNPDTKKYSLTAEGEKRYGHLVKKIICQPELDKEALNKLGSIDEQVRYVVSEIYKAKGAPVTNREVSSALSGVRYLSDNKITNNVLHRLKKAGELASPGYGQYMPAEQGRINPKTLAGIGLVKDKVQYIFSCGAKGKVVATEELYKLLPDVKPANICWALSEFHKEGMLERVSRGNYRLTGEGRKALGERVEGLEEKLGQPETEVTPSAKAEPNWELICRYIWEHGSQTTRQLVEGLKGKLTEQQVIITAHSLKTHGRQGQGPMLTSSGRGMPNELTDVAKKYFAEKETAPAPDANIFGELGIQNSVLYHLYQGNLTAEEVMKKLPMFKEKQIHNALSWLRYNGKTCLTEGKDYRITDKGQTALKNLPQLKKLSDDTKKYLQVALEAQGRTETKSEVPLEKPETGLEETVVAPTPTPALDETTRASVLERINELWTDQIPVTKSILEKALPGKSIEALLGTDIYVDKIGGAEVYVPNDVNINKVKRFYELTQEGGALDPQMLANRLDDDTKTVRKLAHGLKVSGIKEVELEGIRELQIYDDVTLRNRVNMALNSGMSSVTTDDLARITHLSEEQIGEYELLLTDTLNAFIQKEFPNDYKRISVDMIQLHNKMLAMIKRENGRR